jgi:hypothetical protein
MHDSGLACNVPQTSASILLSAASPVTCPFMVETMGLEPTTPCVQSRIWRAYTLVILGY